MKIFNMHADEEKSKLPRYCLFILHPCYWLMYLLIQKGAKFVMRLPAPFQHVRRSAQPVGICRVLSNKITALHLLLEFAFL
jgi:hypothetical protein